MSQEATQELANELRRRDVPASEVHELGNLATIASDLGVNTGGDNWFDAVLKKAWQLYEGDSLTDDKRISSSTLAAINWDDDLRTMVSAFVKEEVKQRTEEE